MRFPSKLLSECFIFASKNCAIPSVVVYWQWFLFLSCKVLEINDFLFLSYFSRRDHAWFSSGPDPSTTTNSRWTSFGPEPVKQLGKIFSGCRCVTPYLELISLKGKLFNKRIIDFFDLGNSVIFRGSTSSILNGTRKQWQDFIPVDRTKHFNISHSILTPETERLFSLSFFPKRQEALDGQKMWRIRYWTEYRWSKHFKKSFMPECRISRVKYEIPHGKLPNAGLQYRIPYPAVMVEWYPVYGPKSLSKFGEKRPILCYCTHERKMRY